MLRNSKVTEKRVLFLSLLSMPTLLLYVSLLREESLCLGVEDIQQRDSKLEEGRRSCICGYLKGAGNETQSRFLPLIPFGMNRQADEKEVRRVVKGGE